MKNLYLILGLIFASFAALQYNDPDPYIWAPYYLFVAAACFLTYSNRHNKLLTIVLLGISLVWASLYLPDVADWFKAGRPGIASTMKAETPYIENMREFLGLVICIVVLGFIYQKNRKSS
jgi:hypothetical protein